MILNNVENIYIGGTEVEKIMFNLTQIWPQLQNTIAEGIRRLSFFGQQNENGGSSSGGNSSSGSGNSGTGGSGEGGSSGSGSSSGSGEGGSSSGSGEGGSGSSGSGSGSSGNEGNTPAIEISGSGSFIYTYRIYGNEQIIDSVTYGVGDQNNNQYIMPIDLSGNIYNIILSQPLMIRNGVADYIDYRTQKRYNGDGTTEQVTMPEFILYQGLNYIQVGTQIIPSKIEIIFNEQKLQQYHFTVQETDYELYGWHLNPNAENPSNAIEYLHDAIGKRPAAMGANQFSYGDWMNAFFMPKPCMLKYDGTVDYYLNPNNYEIKAEESTFNHNDYKAVEYIENTGTQYIETDIVVTSFENTYVDTVMKFGGLLNNTVQTYGSELSYIRSTINYGIPASSTTRILSDYIPTNSGDYILITLATGKKSSLKIEVDQFSSNTQSSYIRYDGWLAPLAGTTNVFKVARNASTNYIRILVAYSNNNTIYPNVINTTTIECGSFGTKRQLFGVTGATSNTYYISTVHPDDLYLQSFCSVDGDNRTAVNNKTVFGADKLYYHCKYHDSYVNSYNSNVNTGSISSSVLPDGNLSIFKADDSYGVFDFFKMRLYRFKVGDSTGVTHDLIPVERKTDGVLGMYDKIGKKFYPAGGTGTFNKGSYCEVSEVDNIHFNGNAMMEWPKIWYKFAPGQMQGEGYFYVSNKKIDNTYHCWCNYDILDNEIEHFYTAIYNCCMSTRNSVNLMRSMSGTCDGDNYRFLSTEIQWCLNNNVNNYTEWNIEIFSDRLLIDSLLVLIGKSLDLPNTFGKGMYNQSDRTLKANYYTGALNQNGLFWGNLTEFNQPMKVFGMENWWGYQFKLQAGIHINTTSNILYLKLTPGQIDGTTVTGFQESTAQACNDYFKIPISSGYSGQINHFVFTNNYIYIKDCGQNNIIPIGIASDGVFPIKGVFFAGGVWESTPYSIRVFSLNSRWYQYGTNLSCRPIATQTN